MSFLFGGQQRQSTRVTSTRRFQDSDDDDSRRCDRRVPQEFPIDDDDRKPAAATPVLSAKTITPSPPPFDEKALYRRSSDLIDQVSSGHDRSITTTRPAVTVVTPVPTVKTVTPPPPPFDEKALYRRSSDLIDQVSSSGHDRPITSRPPAVTTATPGAVAVPTPPPVNEKDLYRRSSDLIDQVSSGHDRSITNSRPPVVTTATPGAVAVPTPPPVNEKDLYRRSSDLIDQQVSSGHDRSITNSRPPAVTAVTTPGAMAVPTPPPVNEKDFYRRSSDLIDQQVSSGHERFITSRTAAVTTAVATSEGTAVVVTPPSTSTIIRAIDNMEAGRGHSSRHSERTYGSALGSPDDEKSLYRRSSDLIDQHAAGNQGGSTSTNNTPPTTIAPGAVAVTMYTIDLEEGNKNDESATFNPVMDRARAASRAAMTKGMSSSDMSRTSCISSSVSDCNSKGGASAYSETIIGADGRATQRPPSMPGAQYVRSRAMGVRPSTFLLQTRRRLAEQQQQLQNAENMTTVVVPASNVIATPPCQPLAALEEAPVFTGFKNHYRKWYIFSAIVCVLVAAIAVGVTFGIKDDTTSSTAHGTKITGTKFSPITKECSSATIGSQVQPNVISQCYCHGNITTVAGDIVARYGNLTATFIRSNYPTFNDTIESCSPQNQALVWLASGDANVDPSSTSPSKIHQRYNLAVLFSLWNGLDWNITAGWLSSDDECTWYGVSCDNNGMMTTLSLRSNLVVGKLHEAVPWLTGLFSLMLDGNNFQGSVIPSDIGQMSNLQYLQLNATRINGTIPNQLGTSIRYMNVADNSLSGTISTQIGDLARLEHWIAGNNNLKGTIPSELGRCTSLVSLEMASNHFAGIIPSQIGLMSSLETLNVNHNNVTGSIPTEIGFCASLTMLDVGHNKMNGTIPSEVGLLTALQFFVLDENTFGGTLPSEIGLCTNLVEFEVSDNQLNGTIPSEFEALGKIELLDLQGNPLTGGVPQKLCEGYNDPNKPIFHCYACGCPVTVF